MVEIQNLLELNKKVRLSVRSLSRVLVKENQAMDHSVDRLNVSSKGDVIYDTMINRSAEYDFLVDGSGEQEQVFQSHFEELPPIVPSPAAITTEVVSDELERLSRSYGQDMNAWLNDSFH